MANLLLQAVELPQYTLKRLGTLLVGKASNVAQDFDLLHQLDHSSIPLLPLTVLQDQYQQTRSNVFGMILIGLRWHMSVRSDHLAS